MNDHKAVDRSLKLIRLLKAKNKGMTIPEMCKSISASERTIYRYLETYNKTGIEIMRKVENDGVYFSIIKSKDDVPGNIYTAIPELHTKNSRTITDVGKNIIEMNLIYSVEEIATGRVFFFTDVKAIINMFPELKRFSVYHKWDNHQYSFTTENYKISRGTLYRSKSMLARYKDYGNRKTSNLTK